MKGLLGSAVSAATNERISKREAMVLDALAERDTSTLAFLREHDASGEVLSLVESFLADDRAAREGLAEPEAHLGALPDDVPAKLEALLENILPEASAAARATLHRHGLNRDGGASVEEKLAHVPDEDLITPFIDRRERLDAELAALERLNERNSIKVESAVSEIERLEKTLADLQEADAKARLGRHEKSRIVSHSVKARNTLKEFRRRVIARNVEQIEHVVLESFQQLLRKTSLVSRIAIDPETFALSLFAPDGGQLDPRRLSAGERQLLAVATLWGLGKASGRALPTAIDTPLGRLDGTHREHLVERYFPNASHQVLLLSTDEEITQSHLRTLEPWIGHRYRLDYDDSTGSTTVSKGYFELEDAA